MSAWVVLLLAQGLHLENQGTRETFSLWCWNPEQFKFLGQVESLWAQHWRLSCMPKLAVFLHTGNCHSSYLLPWSQWRVCRLLVHEPTQISCTLHTNTFHLLPVDGKRKRLLVSIGLYPLTGIFMDRLISYGRILLRALNTVLDISPSLLCHQTLFWVPSSVWHSIFLMLFLTKHVLTVL